MTPEVRPTATGTSPHPHTHTHTQKKKKKSRIPNWRLYPRNKCLIRCLYFANSRLKDRPNGRRQRSRSCNDSITLQLHGCEHGHEHGHVHGQRICVSLLKIQFSYVPNFVPVTYPTSCQLRTQLRASYVPNFVPATYPNYVPTQCLSAVDSS
ncbi:hypothetical protein POVWA2_009360 [Plasmodium ovale wallikeri]|uniref:Uncharacterized protein n=1 Tax=Plasmodium ovale wallikeri TaxID=864142 RepID=A0A1A8YLI0_PLAOA|nr:hypothetical protein POVWA1_009350 [Plasmodium ovale wallikeri]SBT32412.1 hypothetical protein POVWA2_009360 [Plasmodium ovale wallikeri]